jgi:hypothetical protein
MNNVQMEAMAYQRAQRVMDSIKRNKAYLTREEYKQLRKRAVDDVDGADKELAMLLKERRGL